MLAPSSLDFAVIGGGPAGAVAARLLAGWGHSVTLLTRPAPQRALAESLPPSILKLLDHVGLRTPVDAAGFLRAGGNSVWWEEGPGRVEPFAAGALGYQVDRTRFDRLLLRQAEEAGARVHRRATVREVSAAVDEAGGRRVRYETATGSHALSARWVLDCTGRAGLTARHGWRAPEPALRTTALVAAWDCPGGWPVDDPTHTLVESYPGGWSWSVPLSTTRRQVTVMVDPTLTPLAGRGRLAAAYRLELGRTRHIAPLLRHARQVGQPWAREASPYTTRCAGEPGLLLAGDAATFADPLSSFGVKKAIASAWRAAVVARSALLDPAITAAALALHEAREQLIAEALRRHGVEFSRSAAARHAGDYWAGRAGLEAADGGEEPDPQVLRQDPEVLAAFGELKRRDRLTLRPAAGLRREPRAAIRDDWVSLHEHLVVPAFPAGIRWLRNLDLVRLADLAVGADQVPGLLETYEREVAPAPLPDFLGALAVLVGKGVLEFA